LKYNYISVHCPVQYYVQYYLPPLEERLCGIAAPVDAQTVDAVIREVCHQQYAADCKP